MPKTVKVELRTMEEQKLFHFLSPFIEQAGYRWTAKPRISEFCVDVLIEPENGDKQRIRD